MCPGGGITSQSPGIKVQTSETFHNGCHKGRRLVKVQAMQGAWLRRLQDENGSYSEKDPTERSMDLQVEIAEKKSGQH